jgi:Zinc finger, C3HC4 type (RING finger)
MAAPASSSCPICFEEPAEGDDPRKFLIRGKHCSHGFCKACLDKILLLVDEGPAGPHRPQCTSPHRATWEAGKAETIGTFSDVEISGIPTQGSCPICRARLSLFDVKWVCNQEDAGEGDANGDDDDDESRHPYGNEIVADWKRTPLAGKIYGRRRGIGFQSYPL